MITVSGHILLYVFGGLGALLLIVAFFHLYHALTFGNRTFLTIMTSGVFIAGIAVILWAGFHFLAPVDWSVPLTIQLPAVHFLTR